MKKLLQLTLLIGGLGISVNVGALGIGEGQSGDLLLLKPNDFSDQNGDQPSRNNDVVGRRLEGIGIHRNDNSAFTSLLPGDGGGIVYKQQPVSYELSPSNSVATVNGQLNGQQAASADVAVENVLLTQGATAVDPISRAEVAAPETLTPEEQAIRSRIVASRERNFFSFFKTLSPEVRTPFDELTGLKDLENCPFKEQVLRYRAIVRDFNRVDAVYKNGRINLARYQELMKTVNDRFERAERVLERISRAKYIANRAEGLAIHRVNEYLKEQGVSLTGSDSKIYHDYLKDMNKYVVEYERGDYNEPGKNAYEKLLKRFGSVRQKIELMINRVKQDTE